ncbi:MAG: trehalase-like domain-containing protein, partial [Actinomycetes bacterium]
MFTDPSRVPLAARAWIADGTTGALVAADGTIDWYCPGRIDAPATFYALIDPEGGALRLGPVRPGTGPRRRLPAGRQRYLPGTNVATLELAARDRRLRVVDFVPWSGPGATPAGRLVRVATALAGPVDVEVEIRPGAAFGPARNVSAFSEGLAWSDPGRGTGTVVRTGFPLTVSGRDRPVWRGVQRLEPGAHLVVTVDRVDDDRHGPLSVDAALDLLEVTTVAWRRWVAGLA